MSTPGDFKAEYQAFIKEYPYQSMQVNGIPVRYQFGGREGAPVMVFFHGLEMQEILQKLSIPEVILVGSSSDGGVYAQMFAKMFPQAVQAMILMTTLTLDLDLLYRQRNIWRKWTSS